jgi:hypothetical protein
MASAEMSLSSVHVQSGLEARKWERFIVNKPARLMAINPGLSGLTSRACSVLDISKGGACLNVNTTIGLPDHYYLAFIGATDKIGCAEVYRSGNRVGIKFIKPIEDELLSGIVRNDFFTK